jgi:hypothetical protein
MKNSNEDTEVTFRMPADGGSSTVDLKRQATLDYCAYFAHHEARKDEEAKRIKMRGYRPLSRRVKGRRVF